MRARSAPTFAAIAVRLHGGALFLLRADYMK
jgi:hypothetical protein